jgi:hypothetical protein
MNIIEIVNEFDVFDEKGKLVKYLHITEPKLNQGYQDVTYTTGIFPYWSTKTKRIKTTSDGSKYLINETKDFRLEFDNEIRVFKLTIKVNECWEWIKITQSLSKDKLGLTKFITQLVNKVRKSDEQFSRNSSSHF